MTFDPTQRNVKPGQLRAPDTTAIHDHKCLNCGKVVDSVATADGSPHREPRPGEPIACIRCGAVMTYEAGALRAFTPEEADDLERDLTCMNKLAEHLECIYIMRQSVN